MTHTATTIESPVNNSNVDSCYVIIPKGIEKWEYIKDNLLFSSLLSAKYNCNDKEEEIVKISFKKALELHNVIMKEQKTMANFNARIMFEDIIEY